MKRVDGRLKRSNITSSEKHQIILLEKNHIVILLVCHYHQKVAHQEKHITEDTVINTEYWVTGGKRLISKLTVIFECVRL